ncbi:hypothetical protein [Nguyenibacter vanlangensis]|uniref:hypothetical protein n=1 Tax=Nguyenibacter vanlangensis TaxID=1216886 RepID=UPI001C3FFE66|nr:hypothetical protein [Nguyenibacter vanlangensis]
MSSFTAEKRRKKHRPAMRRTWIGWQQHVGATSSVSGMHVKSTNHANVTTKLYSASLWDGYGFAKVFFGIRVLPSIPNGPSIHVDAVAECPEMPLIRHHQRVF